MKKKKIAIVPPLCQYFDMLFSKENPFFAPGISSRMEYLFRQEMAEKGYEFISTQEDSFLLDDVVAVIHYAAICPTLIRRNPNKIHIYFALEPFMYYNTPKGMKKLSQTMDYCITLYGDAADPDQRIYSVPGCHNFDVNFQPPALEHRNLLLATVGGDKSTNYRNELYSKRREVIDWFEQHCPDRFAFGGTGWSNAYQQYSSYGGRVNCKLDFLSKAKFALCFENNHGRLGGVTEKIFDAMYAGCVPVYWGAGNITQLIPEDIFIDYRKLGSPEKLFELLNGMSDETIREYQNRIRTWLSSDQTQVFSYQRWEEITLNCIARGKQVRPDANECRRIKRNINWESRVGNIAVLKRKLCK